MCGVAVWHADRAVPYPLLKTVYAMPSYDFVGERRRMIQRMLGGRVALAEPVMLVGE